MCPLHSTGCSPWVNMENQPSNVSEMIGSMVSASYVLNPHETALGTASLVPLAMFNIPSYRAQRSRQSSRLSSSGSLPGEMNSAKTCLLVCLHCPPQPTDLEFLLRNQTTFVYLSPTAT